MFPPRESANLAYFNKKVYCPYCLHLQKKDFKKILTVDNEGILYSCEVCDKTFQIIFRIESYYECWKTEPFKVEPD